jgi:hypothetical protein
MIRTKAADMAQHRSTLAASVSLCGGPGEDSNLRPDCYEQPALPLSYRPKRIGDHSGHSALRHATCGMKKAPP